MSRLQELAGIEPLEERRAIDTRFLDFDKIRDYLVKKHGDKEKVMGMSNLELTRAAAQMKMNESFGINDNK